MAVSRYRVAAIGPDASAFLDAFTSNGFVLGLRQPTMLNGGSQHCGNAGLGYVAR